MKLYDFAGAPNPRRVRIFAAEKGMELTLVPVDMSKGEHKTPEFLKMHPSGKIPVLETDDDFLTELGDGHGDIARVRRRNSANRAAGSRTKGQLDFSGRNPRIRFDGGRKVEDSPDPLPIPAPSYSQ